LTFVIIQSRAEQFPIYNLALFDVPGDVNFINLIVNLDTPEKICQYMADNFIYEPHLEFSYSPYETYIIKRADCNDYVTFAIFIAELHGYKIYQLWLIMDKEIYGNMNGHMIGIYLKDGIYTFSDCEYYFGLGWQSIKDILRYVADWTDYRILDYENKVVDNLK